MTSRGIKQLVFSLRLSRCSERNFHFARRAPSNLEKALSMEKKPQSTGDLVAVCQMTSTNEVDRNLRICEELTKKASSRGAKVCCPYLKLIKAITNVSENKISDIIL